MKLSLVSSEGDLALVQCTGEVNYEQLPVGKEPLRHLLGPDCYRWKILLDFAQVPQIDSVGVGWLVRCHKHFHDAGGRLVLFAPREAVRQVFELLNLGSLLGIATDEASARTLAQAPDAAS
jgi:anti-anti-sigma factor